MKTKEELKEEFNLLVQVKDWDKSLVLADTCLTEFPSWYFGFFIKGTVYSNIGKITKAETEFTKAIKHEPENSQLYYKRAKIKKKLTKYEEALQDYNTAIQLTPNNHQYFLSRGILKLILKNKDAALEDFNQAIKYNPEYALAYYNRGIYRAENNDIRGAFYDLEKAVELDPQFNNELYFEIKKKYEALINKSNYAKTEINITTDKASGYKKEHINHKKPEKKKEPKKRPGTINKEMLIIYLKKVKKLVLRNLPETILITGTFLVLITYYWTTYPIYHHWFQHAFNFIERSSINEMARQAIFGIFKIAIYKTLPIILTTGVFFYIATIKRDKKIKKT